MRDNYFSPRSIRTRLLILTSTLLLIVILCFGLIAYLGIRNSVMASSRIRLEMLSKEFANMLTQSSDALVFSSAKAAAHSSIKNYLLKPDPDTLIQVEKIFTSLQTDTSYVEIRLLDPALKTIFSVRNAGIPIPFSNDSLHSDLALLAGRLGTIGKMFRVDTTLFYPVIIPVKKDQELLGYIVKYRTIDTRPDRVAQISALIGSDAKLYVGNLDNSLWMDLAREVAAPELQNPDKRNIVEFNRGQIPVLGSVHTIATTPWQVCVEFEKPKIVKSANVFLIWISIAGIAIFIIGMAIAWTMSKNIINPLVKLTTASTQIASGQYFKPVQVNRKDEIGKLARAFNAMAIKVQNSKNELQQRAENYKMLFEKNSMPMWILKRSDFRIIDVNEAAIKNYGYSRKEFLDLKFEDLNVTESGSEETNSELSSALPLSSIYKHKRKNGSEFFVELNKDDLNYLGQEATLMVGNDVSEKLKAEAELVKNKVLQHEIITETTIQVQEKEREELGRELHDNINQILASAKLYLELIREEDISFFPTEVAKIYHYVSIAINQIRQISKQLVPPALDSTLQETLRDLTEEIESASPLRITLDTARFDEQIPDEGIKLMIYRIVQEQVNNIIKHARASDVRILLETESDSVNLEISDNGVGFDPAKKSKGIGLRNIENRVKFQKGSISIISAPGRGCTVLVTAPVTHRMKGIL